MRILVTGGAGFIGSHYVRSLLNGGRTGGDPAGVGGSRGRPGGGPGGDPVVGNPGGGPGGDRGGDPGAGGVTEVTVIDRLTYAGRRENLPPDGPRLRFVHGDVCDADLLTKVLPGHDAVVHFAAESHVDRSLLGAAEFVRTNVAGTQTLLDACLRTGVGPVVHVSTDEVYGSIGSGSWTEESPLLPNSPYAASKAGSDLIARAFARTHGMDVRITRCSNNYGPYQHPEKLIPLFVTRFLTGREAPLYGDGRNVREWIHVDDHCRAVHQVLLKGGPGEIYNIGGGSGLTNREIVGMLLELCDADWSLVREVPDRKGHDLRYALDGGKAREELGFEPRWTLDKGLVDTVAWYRDNPGFWRGR